MSENTVEEGKTTAIISYITIIGLIIGFIMNNSKKNTFASFHIRQMIGLTLLSIIVNILTRVSWIVGTVLLVGVIILWVIAFIGAVNGQEKKIPLLGDQFQEWFKSIG